MGRMDITVDAFFNREGQWQQEYNELRSIILDGTPALKSAFEALTPDRQRAYLHYYASARLAATSGQRLRKPCRIS